METLILVILNGKDNCWRNIIDKSELEQILRDVKSGSIELEEAMKRLRILPFEDLGFAKVDHHRTLRKGFPEVIYGPGKSPDQIERVKGRIIGEGGKARLNIENLTNALITVYGRTVAIIGEPNQLRLAVDAISSLSSGSMHGPVYNKLESARRKEKAEKSQLWEDQNVF